MKKNNDACEDHVVGVATSPETQEVTAGVVEALVATSGVRKALAESIRATWPGAAAGRVTAEQLQVLGCRPAQARRILGAYALHRWLTAAAQDGARPRLAGPVVALGLAQAHLQDWEQERMVVFLLDARQRVAATLVTAIGTVSEVQCHPREIYREAVRLAAHSLVLAHNHPSGDPEPSEADLRLTERMADVGRLLGIPLVDHLVIASRRYVSFAERGLL